MPRKFGWIPDFPSHRDFIYKLAPAGPPLPPRFISSVSSPIRDQGDEGSCTGHAAYRAISNARLLHGLPFIDLSPADPYYRAREIEGTTDVDAGAQIRDVMTGIAHCGIATETVWPYIAGNYADPPPAEADQSELLNMIEAYRRLPDPPDRLRAVREIIVANGCVMFGFTVFTSFMSPDVAATGIAPYPGDEDIAGGHAVVIEGYDDTMHPPQWRRPGGVLVANSWGDWGAAHPTTGQRGYFWLPYDYVNQSMLSDDYWTIELTGSIGPD